MLITLKENLEMAEKGNYAVGAFNVPTLESARAALEAAEELQAPIILAHAEVHNEIMPLEFIGPILVELAKKASVPVTVHLDHGSRFDLIKQAIDIGFTSVMIDASHLPFEENVREVKKVVAYAKERNVSVEAELGVMTDSTIGGGESYDGAEKSEGIYTDPETAKAFVADTAIDALAAAFGTVHGIYLEEPKLDFDRLEQIYQGTGKPIVMHGGSGLKEEDYTQTINAGVRKINYYSYAAKAGAEAVKHYVNHNEHIFYHDITTVGKNAMKQNYQRAIEIFMN
ncbi:ketose-bisphosphate aldolase [Gracilibacillus salitolerans]|uniref:Ketose-bisphosphate aldolase n=1 Tax=Gracilibacillus salitolerans TaxID=2663022 RepID=A0A5Q2TMK5_9BACI|nr:class II fructose-bisphosphate aldolase [Gracilibacillus salitolerans]QGH35925.1 ketose-bisphosphate aldolase [Gracilibacillus salitolerans]